MDPQRLTGLLGVLVMIGIALALSSQRGRVPWRLVGAGVGLQFVLAFLLLQFEWTRRVFEAIAGFVVGVIGKANAGIAFVFGEELARVDGPVGFVFAVQVLPVIIFFASLMAVLYHVGVMQRLIGALAWLLRTTMGVTGAEALAMAANVFVGQTEAPLTVKPLLERMTRAQLMTLMVGGFATVAGSVLAAYVGYLGRGDEGEAAMYTKHLLSASVLSAPAALVMARIMLPEMEEPPSESAPMSWGDGEDERAPNVLGAAASGATAGLKLALNVAAMLIAFLALLALVNWPLEALSAWGPVAEWREANGIPVMTLEVLLGWVLAPLAWTMGVGWHDAPGVGSLLGQKIFLTELVAYKQLGAMMHPDAGAAIALSPRSAQIATYALCGFANFGSIAIQIGGLTALAPGRRRDFSSMAFKAMIGGALASWMTASIAGLFIPM